MKPTAPRQGRSRLPRVVTAFDLETSVASLCSSCMPDEHGFFPHQDIQPPGECASYTLASFGAPIGASKWGFQVNL